MKDSAQPRLPIGLLLAATAAVGVGTAGILSQSSALGALFFMNHGVEHTTSLVIERTLAGLLLAATVALAWPKARPVASAILFLGAATLAFASYDQGGYPYSRFAMAAHAMRVAAPLALLLACVSLGGRAALNTLLVAATVTVFALHGYEALRAHPWFIDMTIGFFNRVGSWRVSEAAARSILLAVGVIDIVAAAALLVFRSRWVAYWLALWGLFTAALRVVNYGSGAWAETLVRLPHCLLPLAIVGLWSVGIRSRASKT